jgi:hypothetical protein
MERNKVVGSLKQFAAINASPFDRRESRLRGMCCFGSTYDLRDDISLYQNVRWNC